MLEVGRFAVPLMETCVRPGRGDGVMRNKKENDVILSWSESQSAVSVSKDSNSLQGKMTREQDRRDILASMGPMHITTRASYTRSQ